ncbi:MAG: type I glyceraldehyde-3-phosphate dehydrogenase [Patescibacteria group bacterium]|nr:type I glyceraldehyde-3-phosphate dehydrogenase [Candidatus Beckwithbacteria bacterium]MDZ4228730.1 type I glyceraldehyde-3-phosphate dehydrogenase [Patescibacteria group bacterium]
MIRVAINGFGRIGRLALRVALSKHLKDLEIVAINTSGNMEPAGWAHLFEYDSIYRQYPGQVSVTGSNLVVDGVTLPILAEREPKNLPWQKLGVDLVLECTGVFRKPEEAKGHLEAGAKKVLLSAPPKGTTEGIYMIGLNADKIGNESIISNASCTTNCVAPVAKVMVKEFGVVKAVMTTIHAYTSDQRLLDNSHKDLRRARGAAVNIIPTSTGAAEATAAVVPELSGVFDGLAIRVPVATGSLTDFTFLVKQPTTVDAVNLALTNASKTYLKGTLAVTDKPIVSSDVIGNEASALVDLQLTRVVDRDLVKVMAWYDNEWGYVVRLMELARACAG